MTKRGCLVGLLRGLNPTFGSDAKSRDYFFFYLQTVYMHLKASFKVMARLVNQKIVREGEEGRKDTESYMFR